MSKRRLNVSNCGPELDLVSYGRRGRHAPLHFSQTQIEQIVRTLRGDPEVLVKVSGGGRSWETVRAHLAYIDRAGGLEVRTDEGERLKGKDVADYLVHDWHLDVAKGQYRGRPTLTEKDRRPKQAHNIVFSMPAGTPPHKLLAATQKFAREKFALRNRYAMVLHTEQKHPHVHLVVKAVSEQGDRLCIRKPTLRQWREDFAEYLRELGVPANATPTQLRGKLKARNHAGIYRALERGTSTFIRRKVEAVALELHRGQLTLEPGKAKLIDTRQRVRADWTATAALLRAQGCESLAQDVEHYIRAMPPAATEKELLAKHLLAGLAAQRVRGHAAKLDQADIVR